MAAKAVIVGVINYKKQSIPNLPAVAVDCRHMRRIFEHSNIDILEELRDVGVTELYTTLRRICRSSRNTDDLIIYFSGHGQAFRGRDYLMPADATVEDIEIIRKVLVPVDLDGALQESSAASITFIIDACRDGVELKLKGLSSWVYQRIRSKDALRKGLSDWSFQRIKQRSSSISIVYSCAHGQHSHVINDELGSIFTFSLYEAITAGDYSKGTIANVLQAAQLRMDLNCQIHNKPKQRIFESTSKAVDLSRAVLLFPDGTKSLETAASPVSPNPPIVSGRTKPLHPHYLSMWYYYHRSAGFVARYHYFL
jgi:hypothetical protein